MTISEAPKPPRQARRRAKGPRVATSPAAPLAAFYKSQSDALKAARAEGVAELEVTFRPSAPGAANIRTMIKVEDFAQLWGFRDPRETASTGETSRVPSAKLSRASKEAQQVTTFYKTKEELFRALEKQG